VWGGGIDLWGFMLGGAVCLMSAASCLMRWWMRTTRETHRAVAGAKEGDGSALLENGSCRIYVLDVDAHPKISQIEQGGDDQLRGPAIGQSLFHDLELWKVGTSSTQA
jgi:hypothetical protein